MVIFTLRMTRRHVNNRKNIFFNDVVFDIECHASCIFQLHFGHSEVKTNSLINILFCKKFCIYFLKGRAIDKVKINFLKIQTQISNKIILHESYSIKSLAHVTSKLMLNIKF